MLLFLLACSKGGDLGDSVQYACVDVPQVDGTSVSGIEYCSVDDLTFGYLNRESATACTSDPKDTVSACVHEDTCHDCAAGQVCGAAPLYLPYCQCYTVCGSDADCGADETCVCALEEIHYEKNSTYTAAAVDQCLPGNCRTGADCASGECGAQPHGCDDGPIAGFYCRTADDVCHSNADCPHDYRCAFDPALAHWACREGSICD